MIDYYFSFLVENELGFYCDNPSEFPDIKLDWHVPSEITNAIIEYDNPNNYDLIDLIDQIQDLGCKFIEFRVYRKISLEEIKNILCLFDETKIRNISLYVAYIHNFSSESIKEIFLRFQRVSDINIHSAPDDFKINAELSSIVRVSNEVMTNNSHCGAVSPDYFSIDLRMFSESLTYNSCLNKKLSVDIEGNIKNCPSLAEKYGNLKNITLVDVLNQKKFKKKWSITKDQIEVCKVCEFRYICTDCRAYIEQPDNLYSKPLKCGYDPFTGAWTEWSTKTLKSS